MVERDAQECGRLAEGARGTGHPPGLQGEGTADLDAVQGELGHGPQFVEQPHEGRRLGQRLPAGARDGQRLGLAGELGPVEVPVALRQ
ncbi:hypothetical protein [Streptomyces sp. Ag109_G2-15]|uniref:hypothetical protein n=1 Tax=Streptomyces sp. Ag109_G2-15 TaxID=1938850 RepID=UPI00211CDEA4|nr:hypothetical protein [Streptomyces sp. Ag109_G2-15]